MNKFENIVFGNRKLILAILAVVTLACGYFATKLHLDAGFEKQLPLKHEYINTFQEYREKLFGSNRIIVVLKEREGTIWNKDFFQKYKDLTDDIFFLPGIARHTVTSLWTPNTRYLQITEEGIKADDVIPGTVTVATMDKANLALIENNVIRGNFVGRLVAQDFTSAMVMAELLEVNPRTQKRLDYFDLAEKLETEIRQKYEGLEYEVQIIGFAKMIGAIADGAQSVKIFFAVAFFLTVIALQLYSRSWVLTFITLFCSLVSLVWQFGLLDILGYGLDPLAILVPFLVFAIGISHGVQQINLITSKLSTGASSEEAARASFRGLLIPGSMALITDLVGFGTLVLIPIGMIQELAITASIGVALKTVTNLVMLPILASYFRCDKDFTRKVHAARAWRLKIMEKLGRVAEPKIAIRTLAVSLVVFGIAVWQSQGRHVGALHVGSPELHKNARYNLDSNAISENFSLGLNLLTVVVETPTESCINHDHMVYLDKLSWYLENTEGVSLVLSGPKAAKNVSEGWNEGNLKWRALPRNKYALVQATSPIPPSSGLLDEKCELMAQLVFLKDSKATTIKNVVGAIKDFRTHSPATLANLEIDTDPVLQGPMPGQKPDIPKGLEGLKVDIRDTGYENKLIITYNVNTTTPQDLLKKVEAAGLTPTNPVVKTTNIRLASGNMGVQAAINEELEESELPMLLYVYGTILLLVAITYRDWRAIVACCFPLTMATFLGYWFMKEIEIGLTVATLPVMVLAVGLGVDYAFYIYNRLQVHLSQGLNVTESYKKTIGETGMAVVFTAITMAIGVSTWAFSALKFQADMGLLLAFMFMINMIMAITTLPSLAVVLDMLLPRTKPVRVPKGALLEWAED